MLRVACFSLSIAFLAGCGGGGADSEMNGTVMYEGKTLTYGKVIVIDQNGDSRFGVIKPDGKYQVTGLHPGPVKIVVYNLIPSVAAPGDKPTGRNMPLPPGWFAIPEKYSDQDLTDLEFTLEAGANAHDIDLR